VVVSKFGCMQLVFFLWNLVQKSMMITIEMNCWWSYWQPSEACSM